MALLHPPENSSGYHGMPKMMCLGTGISFQTLLTLDIYLKFLGAVTGAQWPSGGLQTRLQADFRKAAETRHEYIDVFFSGCSSIPKHELFKTTSLFQNRNNVSQTSRHSRHPASTTAKIMTNDIGNHSPFVLPKERQHAPAANTKVISNGLDSTHTGISPYHCVVFRSTLQSEHIIQDYKGDTVENMEQNNGGLAKKSWFG